MKMQSNSPSFSRQGFTLVEVLVSSFLTLIILGMLFSVLLGTMDAWEGATSNLESSGDAQLALDILKSDLEGLVARQTQDNQEWLFSGPYNLDPGSFEWGPGTVTNTCLAFLTPSVDRDMADDGSIVAVNYRTAYEDPLDPVGGSYEIFALYKSMEPPDVTFNDVLRFGNQNLLMGVNTTDDGFWDDGVTIEPVDNNGFLMPNVVRFTVSWLVRDPSGDLQRYDETHEVRLSNRLEIYDDAGVLLTSGGEKLEAAEVSVTIISDEGMQRLRFFEGTSNAAGQLSRIINDFGSTHIIRVPIHY